MHVLVMPGELTTAIGAIGDPGGVRELGLEGMPGVDRVVPISRPYQPSEPCSRSTAAAYKPRTSPFAFKGLGVAALEILAEAREETGLPIVTEFLDTSHAGAIAEFADVVQIGARNMQNYALLEVAGKLGKPVLLKRGLASSLDELLMAADYVLKEGNECVMLCERGLHVTCRRCRG